MYSQMNLMPEKFQRHATTRQACCLFAGLDHFYFLFGLVCIGRLYGRKTNKRIGVRKVLGASVMNITALMSKDFLRLVIISFVIASPVAWFFHEQVAGKLYVPDNVEWWVFAVAGFLSIMIALITISFQAIRAAIANPLSLYEQSE
jgi:hypothetical protein